MKLREEEIVGIKSDKSLRESVKWILSEKPELLNWWKEKAKVETNPEEKAHLEKMISFA